MRELHSSIIITTTKTERKHTMKRLLSLILVLMLILSLPLAAGAANTTAEVSLAYRGIKIVVDGVTMNPVDTEGNSTEPFIYDGTTYLPVRAVAGALGLAVGWDDATSTTTVDYTYDANGNAVQQKITADEGVSVFTNEYKYFG